MKSTILTHDSSFHADDVFAVATMLLVVPNADVIRTRDKEKIAQADYVVDVGYEYDVIKKRFDHHQPGGAGVRENGVPYAAFGLVWKEYGEQISGKKEVAQRIDERLVQPLDAHDNGFAIADTRVENVFDYTISDFLYSFLTRPHESDGQLYEIFMKLVGIAKDLIVREVTNTTESVNAEERVLAAYEAATDKRYIVLSEELPWRRIFKDKPEVLYVIYPRNDGYWSVKAVQDREYISRKPLPLEWAGKTDGDLAAITGVPDAIFCHNARFMVAAESKESAIKLAEIALNS